MKITGGKQSGRHLPKNINSASKSASGKQKKNRGAKIVSRLFAAVFLVMVTGVIVVFAYYKIAVKPPPVSGSKRPSGALTDSSLKNPSETASPDPAEELDDEIPKDGRQPLKYTFLIMGTDDGNGNTDTIMVATFDIANSKLDVVSIPRDTMVNVSWPTKKVNSLLANVKIDGTVEKLGDVLGFEVDYYAIINLKAFSALVDAVDGVDYDIPVRMYYNDPAQNLLIDFPKGMRHLNGSDALKVVRFRSYGSGDIGRIGTQQDFLSSAAKQILAKRSSLKITEIVDIFFKYVKGTNTNLEMNHLIYFAQEMMKLDAENIRFETVPGDYNDHVNGASYVSIYADQWLELVNERLNPFYEEIKKEDLSVITRGSNGKIYATDGNMAYSNTSWGGTRSSSGGGSSSGGTATSNIKSGGTSSGGTSTGGGSPNNASGGASDPPPSETPLIGTDAPPETEAPTEVTDTESPPIETEPPEEESPDVVETEPVPTENETQNPDDVPETNNGPEQDNSISQPPNPPEADEIELSADETYGE